MRQPVYKRIGIRRNRLALPMSSRLKAFYDDPEYCYKKYWLGRSYEDQAERIAIKKLFSLIPKKNTLLDLGGGFGRLTSEYTGLFEKCVLMDPSEKLLKEAKKLCERYKNFSVKKGFIEDLSLDEKKFDVVITVRTLHHLNNLGTAIEKISKIISPGGYFILEFANKIRFKSILRAVCSLNLSFFTSHIPCNISQKKEFVPFYSYHPNQIKTLLLTNGFSITKVLSVSNLRHPLFKKLFSLNFLLRLESLTSSAFSNFPLLRFFGPSIFILAKKN